MSNYWMQATYVRRLLARLDAVERERDQYKAKANLFQHIERCEQCRGPHDGCSAGGRLESRCIDALGFDPYQTEAG